MPKLLLSGIKKFLRERTAEDGSFLGQEDAVNCVHRPMRGWITTRTSGLQPMQRQV